MPPSPHASHLRFFAHPRARRLALILACPMSLLLALLIIGWAQHAGIKSLDVSRTALVLALIGLPGLTGVAVLLDRSAARRVARARATDQLTQAEAAVPVVSTPQRESRSGSVVLRHGPHEARNRPTADTASAHTATPHADAPRADASRR